MLNVDYKIIASTINNRMKSRLNALIEPGQNGFIKGRHIGDNIRLLFDVIDFADLNYTWVQFERLIAFDICCHLKRDIDFCNFNKIFGFHRKL